MKVKTIVKSLETSIVLIRYWNTNFEGMSKAFPSISKEQAIENILKGMEIDIAVLKGEK